jgi:DNA mismatch repair protein MutS
MTFSPDPVSPPTVEVATSKAPHRDYRPLDRSKLTPMFQHYTEVKEQYPGALLLYRVGDFFECFFQDSVISDAIIDRLVNPSDSVLLTGESYRKKRKVN